MRRELGMLGALFVICLIIWASNGDFVKANNVFNVSRQVAMLGIMAIGIGFVIITGGIDLSVGSIVGITGVIIAKISSPSAECMGYPIWFGILVAMAVALMIGLVQGLLITRLNLQPFIVTLGFMLMIRGVSQVIVHGGNLSFGSSPFRLWVEENLLQIRVAGTTWSIISYPVLILLIVVILATYLLHFTVFGRYVYAIGGNRDAAEYSGIPVKNVEALTYVISAGLAGVAGVCYAAYIGQMSQNVGIAYELYAIAAAVLGGVSLRGGEGTILGIIIGSAMMRVIYSGIQFFKLVFHNSQGRAHEWRLGPDPENIIIGAVILIAVLLDQVVHLVQARRRTRGAGAAPVTASPRGFPVEAAKLPPTPQ
jgi:ribose transport system permease protein